MAHKDFDGRPARIGSSAAMLGHPARSPATAAERLRPGVTVRNCVETLGSVGFSVAPNPS